MQWFNEHKRLVGWALVVVGGAAWGVAHVVGMAGAEAYATRVVELGGAIAAIGHLPSDREARLR